MPGFEQIFSRINIILDIISFIGLIWISVHLASEDLRTYSAENVRKHFRDRTVLVVAHPDDETMFFGPTLLNLISQKKSVLILCLSNGNADHIGDIRELELVSVVEALGPTVTLSIVKDDGLQDNITSEWDPEIISKHIESHIFDKELGMSQTVLSFDDYGVSGHINHKSIHKTLIKMRTKLEDSRINLLVLRSVDLFRKYSSFLDVVITCFQRELLSEPNVFSLSISYSQYKSLTQLLHFHHSQMVWFRDLYTIFSRYMFINDLEQI